MRRLGHTIMILSLLLSAVPGDAAEAGQPRDNPVREVLVDHEPRWYDRERDDYRRVEVRVREREQVEFDAEQGGQALSIVPVLFYGLILALLIALVAWLLMSDTDLPELDTAGSGRALGPMADLSELPFDVTDTGDPDGALAQALAAGDLRAALIWLYACLLLRLDAEGRVRLHRSKTNRCYLREMADDDRYLPLLRRTVEAFEAMYFGGAEPLRAVIDDLHAGYRQLATSQAGPR